MHPNHRMEHIRLLTMDLPFAPLVNEHHFTLSAEQRPLLEDVRLLFYGYITHAHANTRTAPNDIHFYIDGEDITRSYIAVLKSLLDDEDQGRLRDGYEEGMNAWIDMLEKYGGGYSQDLARDRASRDTLLAVSPFSTLVDQLGNSSAGRFGALHVTNFLWSQIDIPMISLAAVIDHFNEQQDAQLMELTTANRMTVSNGPCRLFVKNWNFPRVFGSVRLQAEMQYHNSLAGEIDQLNDRLEELNSFVEEALTAILDAVDSEGKISRQVRTAQTKTEKALEALEETAAELDSHKRQIASLRATADELKTAIESL